LVDTFYTEHSVCSSMRRRSQGDQDLVPFDPDIEAAARWRSGEARRRKKAEVMMQRKTRGCCAIMPYHKRWVSRHLLWTRQSKLTPSNSVLRSSPSWS